MVEAHPDLFDKYYSEGVSICPFCPCALSDESIDALTKKVGTLSLEAQSKLEQDTVKKEKKAEAKADAEAKKLAASKVTIRRIERNKKKYVTAVQGLETFGE